MPVFTSAVVGSIVLALGKAVGEGLADKIAESITGGGVSEKQIDKFTDEINLVELTADAIHDAWRDDSWAGGHVSENLGKAAATAGFNPEQIAWMKVQIYTAFGGKGGKAFWIKKLAEAKNSAANGPQPDASGWISVQGWLDYFTANPQKVPPSFKGEAKLNVIRQVYDGSQSTRAEAIARYHKQWGEIFEAADEGPLSAKWKLDDTVTMLQRGQGSFAGRTGFLGIKAATDVFEGRRTVQEIRDEDAASPDATGPAIDGTVVALIAALAFAATRGG